MKKIRRSPVMTGLLFVLAVVLLFAGSVGGTQAALQVFSDNYYSAMNLKHIGVTLLENGTTVAYRNYGDQAASGFSEQQDGNLVLKTLEDDPSFQIGRKYPFVLTAQNTGSIDQYLRITVYKYWVKVGDKETLGLKGWFHGISDYSVKNSDTAYDPSTIHLGYGGSSSDAYNTANWVRDDTASTPERDVYYYIGSLSSNGVTAPLFDTLWIDSSITKIATVKTDGNLITYTYAYDGYGFVVQAEVDAIQTHHARDAIRSAWGLRNDTVLTQMQVPIS